MREESKRVRGAAFHLTAAVPIDLFPHTEHCELVLLFERSTGKKSLQKESSLETTAEKPNIETSSNAKISEINAEAVEADLSEMNGKKAEIDVSEKCVEQQKDEEKSLEIRKDEMEQTSTQPEDSRNNEMHLDIEKMKDL